MSIVRSLLERGGAKDVPVTPTTAVPKSDVQSALDFLIANFPLIGTSVQAWSARLDEIAALSVTDGNIIVGNGSSWVAESGATARASLGLSIGSNVQAYSANLDSWAAVNESAYYNSSETDAAIAAALADYTLTVDLASTANGKGASLIGIEDVGGLIAATTVEGALAENRSAIDAIEADYLTSGDIGSSVQAYDAGLASIAGLTTAANKMIYTTGLDAYAVTDLSAFARTLIDDASASAARSTLGVVIGTDVQAYDATLQSLSGLGSAADKLAYTTGVDTWSETALTSFARTLLDDTTQGAARTTLGVGSGDSPTFAAVTVGGAGLTVGSSVPFSDTAGSLTLQNVDVLDATTESTIEAAIDTLANLTSIQGVTFTFGAYAATLLNNANEAAFKAAVNLEIGVDVQAYSANLSSWSAVNESAYYDSTETDAAIAAAVANYTLTSDLTSTSAGKGSALIGIEDAGSYFAGSTVESALQYLGDAVAALDQAVVLKGSWDASVGSFPGSGSAHAGWSYVVSVDGTVDGVEFVTGDRIVALIDNASTTTYAANWLKLDYTDRVSSVAGRTGAVTIASTDITDSTSTGRSLMTAASASAARSTLGLVIGTDVQAFDSELAAIAGLTSAADRLPYFTGSGTAALATFTAFGRSLVDDADAAAARTTLGLVIGTNVQAYDADLTTWAGLTPSANAQSLVTAANYAAMRALLDLEAGTDFYSISAADAAISAYAQPLDGELTAIAGLVSAADRLPYFTGSATAALATFTSFGRSLVDDADAATARSTLGVVIGTDVQAYDADLTTWAGLTPSANAQSLVTAANYAAMRALLDLEAGTDFYSISAADAAISAYAQPLDSDLTAIAALTTNSAGRSILTLTDPNADRLAFWDDSAGSYAHGTPTNGVEVSGTNVQMTSNQRTGCITFIIDGGGSAITTGIKGDFSVPANCTITSVTALADQTGSIVIDIWKDTFANFPPTDADSITSASPITLSSVSNLYNPTLSGWTTSISAGDILRFNVDSVSAITRLTIEIRVTKT